MEVVYSPRAKEEIQSLPDKVKDRIREKIEELKDDPLRHEDSKIIHVQGRNVYRLKIKEKRGGKVDHRAIYDVENGRIRIYSIIHRDEGYDKDEISDRLK